MRSAALFAGLLLAAGLAAAAEPGGERPTPGLDATVDAVWTRLPLRDWAARASSLAGRPVLLDRRLDPSLPVTLTARQEPLRDVIASVAAGHAAVLDELAGTVRLVPGDAAGRASRGERDRELRIGRLPARLRAMLAIRRPWRWPAGVRPQDLLVAAVGEAGLEVDGIEEIPHDHWPAADLPPLSLAERLDLVLAHFDRRVLWGVKEGSVAGRIVAIDAELLPAAAAPEKKTSRPRGPRRTVKVRDEFTLRLEAPLDQALHAIAGQLGLVLELDEQAIAARGIAAQEIVRADVARVSRDELLDAILQPLGLGWTIEEGRLNVFPTGPDGAPRPEPLRP